MNRNWTNTSLVSSATFLTQTKAFLMLITGGAQLPNWHFFVPIPQLKLTALFSFVNHVLLTTIWLGPFKISDWNSSFYALSNTCSPHTIGYSVFDFCLLASLIWTAFLNVSIMSSKFTGELCSMLSFTFLSTTQTVLESFYAKIIPHSWFQKVHV